MSFFRCCCRMAARISSRRATGEWEGLAWEENVEGEEGGRRARWWSSGGRATWSPLRFLIENWHLGPMNADEHLQRQTPNTLLGMSILPPLWHLSSQLIASVTCHWKLNTTNRNTTTHPDVIRADVLDLGDLATEQSACWWSIELLPEVMTSGNGVESTILLLV